MTSAQPLNERARLRALHALEILDTPPEPNFDRITRLAQNIFGVPMAAISLIDEERQWFKSRKGLSLTETPRNDSFCARAILAEDVLVVSNTFADVRFRESPLVCGEPHIRFYAGAPLVMEGGYSLGALCIMDTVSRPDLDARERAILAGLAEAVVEQCETRHKERELAAAKETAEHANQTKGEFLSRVSHELRTPMNAILGFTQLLELDELSEVQRSNVNRILRAGKHLLTLLNEVLEISRIEAGRSAVELEPVKIADVVREAVEMVHPLLGERRITLRVEAPEAGWSTVLADPQKLTQVILNLLSNAIKYNREGGEIVVTEVLAPEDDGERVRIRVADTGNGISAELQKKLFQPFERLGADRTKTPGTGLGLALCKKMVELMRGSIGIESTPGAGSTFWVQFTPFDAGQTNSQSPPESPAEVKETPGPVVLYIEDTLVSIHLIKGILKRRALKGDAKVRLISAMQGNIGLEMAQIHAPDLILLDLHLPDMSGMQVLHQLKADRRTASMPVVVLTGDSLPGTQAQVLEAGAVACLSKPIDVPRFLETVTPLLEESTK
jgi:signal transduction histidine kinase/ActR/RegA family two-component response regulator